MILGSDSSFTCRYFNFADLQSLIDAASVGSTIYLNYDVHHSATNLVINKNVTIEGNGHMIDAGGNSRTLTISANGATLKNLKLTQFKHNSRSNLAVFTISGNYVSLIDCNFTMNSIVLNDPKGAITYRTGNTNRYQYLMRWSGSYGLFMGEFKSNSINCNFRVGTNDFYPHVHNLHQYLFLWEGSNGYINNSMISHNSNSILTYHYARDAYSKDGKSDIYAYSYAFAFNSNNGIINNSNYNSNSRTISCDNVHSANGITRQYDYAYSFFTNKVITFINSNFKAGSTSTSNKGYTGDHKLNMMNSFYFANNEIIENSTFNVFQLSSGASFSPSSNVIGVNPKQTIYNGNSNTWKADVLYVSLTGRSTGICPGQPGTLSNALNHIHSGGTIVFLTNNYTSINTHDIKVSDITVDGNFSSFSNNCYLNITANNVNIKNFIFVNNTVMSIICSGSNDTINSSTFINNSADFGGYC